jgi:hypothetical protein
MTHVEIMFALGRQVPFNGLSDDELEIAASVAHEHHFEPGACSRSAARRAKPPSRGLRHFGDGTFAVSGLAVPGGSRRKILQKA